MTTCMGKSNSFDVLLVSFVDVFFLQILCVFFFPSGSEDRMWDVIVSIPDHCLSIYFKQIYANYVHIIGVGGGGPGEARPPQ